MPPPLPPGFVLAPPAAAPMAAPGGRPTLTPLGPRPTREPPPQTPTNAEHDRLENIRLQQQIDANAPPPVGGAPIPGNASLHGEAYLATLPQQDQAMVRALSDGRIPWPTGRAAVDPHFRSVVAATGQFDPTFDAVNYQSRLAARRNRTSGPMFNNGVAISTAIDHLGVLADATDQLHNMGDGSFDPLFVAHGANAFSNWAGTGSRGRDVNSFSTAADAAATELTRAFRQAGGNETDVQGWRERLNAANTPGELHGAIVTAIHLLQGRLAEQMTGYNQAMGRSDHPSELLSPTARAVMNRLDPGYIPQQGAVGAAVNSVSDRVWPPGPGAGGTPPGAPPNPPNPSTTQPPNPPEGGGTGGDDPNTLVVNISGQGSPAFEAAFAEARRSNPSLTRTSFDDQRRAARAAAMSARAAEAPPTTLERMTNLFPPVAVANLLATQFGGDGSSQAVTRGALDTGTLGFSDEAQASLSAATGSGTFDDNLAIRRGIADYDSQNHPFSRAAGQLAGGLALPIGEAPTLARLAITGGAYGAAYGAGSGEGIEDRLIRAGEGGVSGAIGAPAIKLGADAAGATFRALRGLVSGRSGSVADAGGVAAQDLIQAAGRQNVDVLPADVSGPGIRRLTAGMAQLPFGSSPIVNAAQRTTNQVGARVGEIAAAEGAPVRQEALGTVASDAAQGYIDRSGAEGRRLYDAARNGAGDTTATADGAIAALDGHIAELSSTPSTSAPELSALQRLRADLADEVQRSSQVPTGVLDAQGNPINRATQGAGGPRTLDIDALRRLRTNVRAMSMEEGLRGTDFQRRAGDVLTHLSEDVANSLSPEAAGAFREADRHWAHRLNVIDDVMSNVIGPQGSRSPEQVTQRLISMSRSDSGRLKTFVDNATPEEGGVIRSSLINELGRAPSGQQGAEGDKFSLSTFLTNWDRLPERSRNVLFRGESRAAIEDLATIAEGSREAGKYANRSNTGGAVNTGDIMRGLSIYSAWGSAGASAIVENLTGRLLASPRFARWLARPAADAGTRMRRLAQIVARQPQLSADIIPIQRALETTTGRAAAQQEDDRR